MELSNVSMTRNTQPVNFNAQVVAEDSPKAKEDNQSDTFVSNTEAKKDLTVKDKQEILKQARTTAAGWSVFGEIISTLYFALRSDKTVAEKYDLDQQKDKDFIKTIKAQQVLYTVPSIIPGYGSIPAVASWLYNKCFVNADKINTEKGLSL